MLRPWLGRASDQARPALSASSAAQIFVTPDELGEIEMLHKLVDRPLTVAGLERGLRLAEVRKAMEGGACLSDRGDRARRCPCRSSGEVEARAVVGYRA